MAKTRRKKNVSRSAKAAVRQREDSGEVGRKVNLLHLADTQNHGPLIEIVRLGADEIAVVPFTTDMTEISVHYCTETEINGYVHCNTGNGEDCVLCHIGRDVAKRYLLPVYVPAERRVGILRLSDSMRPRALLPQLVDVISSAPEGVRQVVFIKKQDQVTFETRCASFPDDVDDGAEVIKQFVDHISIGELDISTIAPRLSNEALRGNPSITEQLKLRNIQ